MKDDVYNLTIRRIVDQNGAPDNRTVEVLAWVYLAERPLSLAELRRGLATEVDDDNFDPDNLPARESLSGCLGLVWLNLETGLVGLVHLSLAEIFHSHDMLGVFPPMLANNCLTYVPLLPLHGRRADGELAAQLGVPPPVLGQGDRRDQPPPVPDYPASPCSGTRRATGETTSGRRHRPTWKTGIVL